MAGDISLVGHWVAGVAARNVVKILLEMSKPVTPKRHHNGAAKFSGLITKKNKTKRGKQNENDTSKNEKPSDADS
jgi:hypothetical protein